MYKHHEESLQNMIGHYRGADGVIALVFGGSVAKGMERPDSDLDGMCIVTEEKYAELRSKNRLAECVTGECTYPGGYFDVKFMTKAYLQAAAEKGSEPTRHSFIASRVLFTSDPEIEEIVSRIPVFQKGEKQEKMTSFYSGLWMNYEYFWTDCKPEGYMKTRVASEMVYHLYRLILQENEILFPCNRRLEEYVAKAPDKPPCVVENCRDFLAAYDSALLTKIIGDWKAWTAFDFKAIRSREYPTYIADFEQWWLNPRPQIFEW